MGGCGGEGGDIHMDFTDCWFVNAAIDHERTRWEQFFEAYGTLECDCGFGTCPLHDREETHVVRL